MRVFQFFSGKGLSAIFSVFKRSSVTFSIIAVLLCSPAIKAQVSSEPVFPKLTAPVTIFFDASKGNKGLMDHNGDLYAHTGVITDKSDPNNPGDWKYVKTNWGINTPSTKLTKISPNLYSLTISNIRSYYGVPSGEKILKLAFVFRSGANDAGGNYKEAKDEDGNDLFVDVYNEGVHVKFIEPSSEFNVVELGEELEVLVIATASGPGLNKIQLFEDGVQIAQTTNDSLTYSIIAQETGYKKLSATATGNTGESSSAQTSYIIPAPVQNAARPSEITQGIHYDDADPTKVTLSLLAPFKDRVFVFGDFTEWELMPEYQMKRHQVSHDEVYWWLEISGLEPGKEYGFQYLVDEKIRIADPYAEKVLHPDDSYIEEETYPNLKPYPAGKTTEYVAVLQTDRDEFVWTDQDYIKPKKENLIIYELLIRDFREEHTFASVIESLDYLENLGINAIELLPVNEFEGNSSWGYNPAFYFATDRYYGPANDLKRLVNEAHNRGIAVILDAVLNHSFGQSPMVRLYNEGDYGQPTPQNIWFNVEARHPFNVGYDFDHSSRFTQQFIDDVNRYWIEEYHIDGYRYDLSKGFTQNFTTDVGAWNQYDQGRIDILNRMKHVLHEKHPDTYLILEHLGNNDEETVLANSGFMLWGIMHEQYKEAALGHIDANLERISYQNRGWNDPHLVGYMESHDEERQMFELQNYGNEHLDEKGNIIYSTKVKETALNRLKLAHAFLLAVPGPKMIWQFGELGYDVSIDENGRTGEKPILWEYFDDADRKRLYKTVATLANLKTTVDAFETPDFEMDVWGKHKKILLKSANDVQVIGNFDIHPADIKPYAHNSDNGKWWYEYFSGDSLFISNSSSSIGFAPGELRIYSTQKLPEPEPGLLDYTFAEIALEPTSVIFDEQKRSNNPPPFTKQITLTNSGTAPLVVTDITNLNSVFSIDKKSFSVHAGSSVDLTITYNPTSTGQISDHFVIKSTTLLDKRISVSGNYRTSKPGAVVLTSPANNALNTETELQLVWQKADNTEFYELEVSNSETEEIIFSEDEIIHSNFIIEDLEYKTSYSWRVRPYAESEMGDWSNSFTFTTKPDVPQKVSLLFPHSAAASISTSPTFRWAKAKDAEEYQLVIAEDELFLNPIILQNNIENPEFQASGLEANTTFYWRVRASNSTGNGEWSDHRNFTTSSLGTPLPDFPSNNAVHVANNTFIKWNHATNADSYILQISKDESFRKVAQFEELADTLFQPGILEKNHRYFWRVKSINMDEESGWSLVYSFHSIFDTPATPTFVSVENPASEVPDEFTLNWNTSSLASTYELHISENSQFSPVVFDSSGILENSFDLKHYLQRDAHYFWRVRAINTSDTSAWSDTLSFKTLPATPAAPMLLSPADSLSDQSVHLDFSWASSGDDLLYRFQLSADANFEQKMDTSITDTTFSIQDLEHDKTYYWRVKAESKGGAGSWSSQRLFRTKIPLPATLTNVLPLSEDVINPNENEFVWTNSLGATSYHIQISEEETFETSILDSTGIITLKLTNIALPEGAEIFWRVRGINRTGFGNWSEIQKVIVEMLTSTESENVPKQFELSQNYPNPFNPTTTIKYALPFAQDVTLEVFNIAGQKVATLVNKRQDAGYHSVQFNAAHLASGLYLYRIKTGNFQEIKKLLLIK